MAGMAGEKRMKSSLSPFFVSIGQKIKLIGTLFEKIFLMFMHGEKVNKIKSACFTDYANYLAREKNIEDAIKYYNRALSCYSNNPYAYSGLASAFIIKKMFKDALEACNKAISIKPSRRLYILQSIIYNNLGELLLAGNAFESSVKFFDNSLSDAYDGLACTYWFYNMHEVAEKNSKEAIKIKPNDASYHYHLAAIYAAKKEYQKAKQEFAEVLKLSTDRKYKAFAKKEIGNIDERLKKIRVI